MARSVGAAGSPRALLIAALFLLHHLASPAAAQTVISDCKPDFLEPNDDFQNSTYVALPVMAPALTLCPAGDRDFFRFRLTNATELTFAISCDTPELKLEGFLWDWTSGRLVLDGATNLCNYTATLRPQPSDAMWWFFEIQSADTQATGSYSLYIKQGPFCSSNDTNLAAASAELITALPYDQTHSLCPRGTEQWFRIAPNETKNVTIVTDCAALQFPPKQLIGVWSDGVNETVVINATANQCYYLFTNLPPRNASNPYTLRIYSLRQAAGPYRLLLQETQHWTFPPPQLPSHRLFATFVLLSVLSVILCGLLALFCAQMRGPQEEGLLEEEDAQGDELANPNPNPNSKAESGNQL